MSVSEWREAKLCDIGEIVGGGTPSTKEESYYGGDIPWITPKDLSTHNERYIYRGERSITEEGLKNSSAKLMPKGTVLFSSRAPIGYVAIAGKELCTNQGFKSLIPKNGVADSEFIYYLFKHKKSDIEAIASGTTFLEVSGSAMKNISILLPPLPEQKAIAATLSALDDMIELNNQINKTLEEMAQAIFKSWFVDFEPFRDGNFEESELGLIPKGWKVGTFGEVAEITSGKRPVSKQDKETPDFYVPLVGASCIMGYVNEALYNEPIIVIGRVGTHGIVQRFNTQCWPSDNTLVIKSNHYELAYQILKGIDYRALNRGSTQPLITQTDIKNYKIVIPDSYYLSIFEDTVKTLYKQYTVNNSESRLLERIRDMILPKLINGEIRVPVEEVV